MIRLRVGILLRESQRNGAFKIQSWEAHQHLQKKTNFTFPHFFNIWCPKTRPAIFTSSEPYQGGRSLRGNFWNWFDFSSQVWAVKLIFVRATGIMPELDIPHPTNGHATVNFSKKYHIGRRVFPNWSQIGCFGTSEVGNFQTPEFHQHQKS